MILYPKSRTVKSFRVRYSLERALASPAWTTRDSRSSYVRLTLALCSHAEYDARQGLVALALWPFEFDAC